MLAAHISICCMDIVIINNELSGQVVDVLFKLVYARIRKYVHYTSLDVLRPTLTIPITQRLTLYV